MTARIAWNSGDLIAIKLSDETFTIAQMLTSPILRLYDINSKNDEWSEIDWSKVAPPFQVFVGNIVKKNLGVRKVKIESIPNYPMDSYWIKPYTSMDDYHYKGDATSFSFLGGKLIDLGPQSDHETTTAPTIKHDLSLPNDRDIIEKYELTNMWGDKDLNDRLVRYFRTGLNRDDLKFEVFPKLWDDRETLRPLTRRLPEPLR